MSAPVTPRWFALSFAATHGTLIITHAIRQQLGTAAVTIMSIPVTPGGLPCRLVLAMALQAALYTCDGGHCRITSAPAMLLLWCFEAPHTMVPSALLKALTRGAQHGTLCFYTCPLCI
jgi:hypothetical protein